MHWIPGQARNDQTVEDRSALYTERITQEIYQEAK